ncbi:hypothetical protein [Nesterenkonia pannonica]|uniref:hypothetical protein n=1 Tax=Nesterenkonia pannonica TaxID=1548602 RepID=UPI002164918D|nr:hypothetical protein [Nesterenkonia pannonica]
MAPVRVAVLGHTAETGGAEIALMRLLEALDPRWQVTVILFSPGSWRVSSDSGESPFGSCPWRSGPPRAAGRS